MQQILIATIISQSRAVACESVSLQKIVRDVQDCSTTIVGYKQGSHTRNPTRHTDYLLSKLGWRLIVC